MSNGDAGIFFGGYHSRLTIVWIVVIPRQIIVTLTLVLSLAP